MWNLLCNRKIYDDFVHTEWQGIWLIHSQILLDSRLHPLSKHLLYREFLQSLMLKINKVKQNPLRHGCRFPAIEFHSLQFIPRTVYTWMPTCALWLKLRLWSFWPKVRSAVLKTLKWDLTNCGWWAALTLTKCKKVRSSLFWKFSPIQR